jgi:hypothetical protein
MHATLSFNLDEPDERMAHLRAVKATEMAIVLFEVQTQLTKKLEALGIERVEVVMEEINKIYESQNIILDELIN